jgi:hypothetical protein
MATSGTVGQTRVNVRQLIDGATRRCKIPPPKVSREDLQVAKELLFEILSSWSNRGLFLPAIQNHILPMYPGIATIPCPVGTVDALNTNIRQVTRFTGKYDSSEGTAGLAFDGDTDTACTQLLPGGWIAIKPPDPILPTNFGILFNSGGPVSFIIQSSEDTLTWTNRYEETDYPSLAGSWYWWDVEGLQLAPFWRILAVAPTVLDVAELVFAGNPLEIPLSKINRDDYMNMPNKAFPSRPVQFYYDKQVPVPHAVLWPTPAYEFTFWQVVMTTQRLIQDPGALTNEIEIPAGGLLALKATLAYQCSGELMNSVMKPGDLLDEMNRALNDFWAGQTDSSPTRLTPNISPYTR